ncbi:hypothetical protein, partial [uncultured Dialister sp.]|uniref:hypothetical protein n=1 Tax=uncultured Dialister sp. TaxID=278064 RepID=UPI00265D2BEB
RNADFILIAREGDTTTLGAKGPVKLTNPPAVRPVNPKNPHAAGVSIGSSFPFYILLFTGYNGVNLYFYDYTGTGGGDGGSLSGGF